MKVTKTLLIIILLVLALPSLCFAGTFKVIRVSDGDTLTAVGHHIKITVRLVGIDAPETSKSKHEPGQPFSQKSKKYLAAMVLNKNVSIKKYGTDR